MQIKNKEFAMWDLCHSRDSKELKHHYFEGLHGSIFMVDSNDRERLDEAK